LKRHHRVAMNNLYPPLPATHPPLRQGSRWGAFNHWSTASKQVCWAHLIITRRGLVLQYQGACQFRCSLMMHFAAVLHKPYAALV
jgi:hypothetical protein